MTLSELVSLFCSPSASATQASATQASATLENVVLKQKESPQSLRLELRPGLPATAIDGELVRTSRARNVIGRVLAFYLDEMLESGKYAELGYSCLSHYADQRLGMDPRRARELCRAGRVLIERPLIDEAFLNGELSWTKAELLTHGVQEHQQAEWIGRAKTVGCSELKRLLRRHRKNLSLEAGKGGPPGGLPGTEEGMGGRFNSQAIAKLERIREGVMRQRGELVDDSELLNYIVELFPEVERDAEKEAELAVECEQKETPDWLRRSVLARDGFRCVACEESDRLHVHHIVFRRNGGLTREENLTTVCNRCHALIHEGRLFAAVTEPGVLEFRNGSGDLIGPGAPSGAALSSDVLTVLREPLPVEPVLESRPMDVDHSNVPDSEMGDWLRARWHLYEMRADGTLHVRKSLRHAVGRG